MCFSYIQVSYIWDAFVMQRRPVAGDFVTVDLVVFPAAAAAF